MFGFRRYFGNNEMHYYQLKDIMENAYNLTSARNNSKELYKHFTYRVDSTSKVNWNSFKFEYVTGEPLNQVDESSLINL